MIPIETDIEIINSTSKRQEKQNYRFRTFLKGKADKKLDKIVHSIYEEIISQIDCTKCGNCCINLRPCLTKKEIDILSKIDNLPRDIFIEKYTEEDNFEKTKFLKDIPCMYLSDKKCSIYDDRPSDCKSFPHIHKPNFNSRTLGMIEYLGICPIVFNVWERLKMEFRFR